MNSGWIRTQDRKRSATAAASTLCLYILAFLGAWAIGRLAPASLASVPSTVIVDLGGSEGPPGGLPLGLENAPERPANAALGAAPLPAATPAAPAAAAKGPAPASKVAPIPEASAKSAAPSTTKSPAAALAKNAAKAAPAKTAPAETAAQVAAREAAAQEAAAAQAAAAQAAAAQAAREEADAAALAAERAAPAKSRTFGSSPQSASSKAGSGAPVAPGGTGTGGPGVSGGTGSVTFRGSEMGNALATTFGASSGQVGRNIYVPIYLYMPLPSRIEDSIFRNIQAKETFRGYYQQSGSEWRLKAQVPLPQRGEFWTMLEAAGYDASTADFKTDRKLNPVTVEFAVSPLSKNRVELIDLRLVSSSGSSEVDEAVIYGFRQATFFNKTGNAVAGRFVYGF